MTIEPTVFDDSTVPDFWLVKTEYVFDGLPAAKTTAAVSEPFKMDPLFVIDKPFPNRRIPSTPALGLSVPLLIRVLGCAGSPSFQSPLLSNPSDVPVQVTAPTVVTQSARAVELNERIVEANKANLIATDRGVGHGEARDEPPEIVRFTFLILARLILTIFMIRGVVLTLQVMLHDCIVLILLSFGLPNAVITESWTPCCVAPGWIASVSTGGLLRTMQTHGYQPT